MGKLLMFFKILLSVILFSINSLIIYLIFFSKVDHRFNLAGYTQLTYFSDKMFSIINFQHPNYSTAFMEKSVAYTKTGDFNNTFYYLDKAVEIDPLMHLGYRGWIKYEFLRDYDGAIIDFKRLDQLNNGQISYPWGRNIFELLGNSFAAKKEYKNALKEYKNYLITTNENSYTGEFFMFYAYALEQEKDYLHSLENYDKAIKLDSLRFEHHYYKAALLYKIKKYKQAKKYLDYSVNLYNSKYMYRDIYNDLYLQVNKTDLDSLYYKLSSKAIN